MAAENKKTRRAATEANYYMYTARQHISASDSKYHIFEILANRFLAHCTATVKCEIHNFIMIKLLLPRTMRLCHLIFQFNICIILNHSQHFIGDCAANGMIEREKGGKEGRRDGERAREGSENLNGC